MRTIRTVMLLWILFVATTLYTTVNIEQVFAVGDPTLNVIKQNRVALTCGDSGGQGTITNVDQTGTWVRTARHVVEGVDTCTCMFNDGSLHTGYVSKVYNKSDEAVLFLSRTYWPTQASMSTLKLGTKLVTFGEIHLKTYPGWPAFGWDFDNTPRTGVALLPVIGYLLKADGYPAPSENLILTSVYSAPGSSGEGVYDMDGNMVGIISGGSTINHNETIIVNVEASMEDEN